ncbi:FHA domain protein [Limnobacter thiooxidans]|uniref:FHA domain-containing protein n=2 Tax=Limnobacter thiooxidans TaxID=131080 RepID=A0AA86J966_9BURK|nr:FHA domain protein [Limnobacter thiooxidans]BET27440.1 hypothetical protein RGQ30_29410 [Limnobacter thiooxidans]
MNTLMNSSFVLVLDTVNGAVPNSRGVSTQWIVPIQGGTVGRSPDCSWVIADPNRVMSRQHAKVDCDAQGCHWTDLGTNSTLLNGKPLSQGQRILLNVGDVLKIGDCVITLAKVQDDWSSLPEFAQPEPVDPLASLWPVAPPALSIDDLLSGLESPLGRDQADDPCNASVLAQRMYVGSQAGLDIPQQAVVSAQLIPDAHELERVKTLLKISVQGYMQLLQARRAFQEETGGTLTTISSKANNPLKFSATAEDALNRLLDQSSPSYLSGEQALVQACQDILAHMQISVEHSRFVMTQVKSTLSPQSLQDELAQSGAFKLGLGASRKARLWDLYCERYDKLGDTWN